MLDLHMLPKFRDSWSFLYVEHCTVDQENKAIAIHDATGRVSVPCATLALLMLGPGTKITHAAVKALAENGCLAVWCGEMGVRFYAQGLGETRKGYRMLHQARMCSDPDLRLKVVRKLYQMRFDEPLDDNLALREIRGKEGMRVRSAYASIARETGVEWKGRSYSRDNWKSADPVNRALSTANACLYGICHAGILSAGFSPALGFIHTGRMLSFVYDIADLYKTKVTIPVAFKTVAEGTKQLERRVRLNCRDLFRSERLLDRIVPDIEEALFLREAQFYEESGEVDEDGSTPGHLWDTEHGVVDGGVAYGLGTEGDEDGRDDP